MFDSLLVGHIQNIEGSSLVTLSLVKDRATILYTNHQREILHSLIFQSIRQFLQDSNDQNNVLKETTIPYGKIYQFWLVRNGPLWNFFLNWVRILCPKNDWENFLIGNHCKTIYKPVRIGYSSCRVYWWASPSEDFNFNLVLLPEFSSPQKIYNAVKFEVPNTNKLLQNLLQEMERKPHIGNFQWETKYINIRYKQQVSLVKTAKYKLPNTLPSQKLYSKTFSVCWV